ncbi:MULTISPECIES: ectoine/hydroxyectoine ABC transporter permease subunit EhuD [unclassified Streptomyces]|uniref:ectoine/hydroxyectoine ABC transporter permease subunit EhuD n=1 Tax=unclassified Streptomyces TaxID=2593676 RepID=UPI0016615FF2|nr:MULTISPECIES: ectoine/hydroxyectoine ABC transporter permease subunit EhuD [unclassified Streptomyces]MBD0707018.1 ectoine/hydroxyectoine ABC transporter permease subunit EhuD [Streptomyces sp. CBMA291]MBD0712957.1 ectoine/hydroxyectoine ABC transporter permease subunit EhuD [Streptomyces sp. CBMA370]
MWDGAAALTALPVVLRGFGVTLAATVLGFAVAAVLGLVLAFVGRAAPRWVAIPVGGAAAFVRSTPLLVQLFAAWVLIPALGPLTLGILVLGVHYAAYLAEVYRAGIDAVPRGQWEACTALSLPRHRVWWAVVLPQAVRKVLPPLGNYAVSLFKETPLLSVITVHEMVHEANDFGSTHFAYLEAFTLAAAVFLLASWPTSLLVRRLEARLAH